MSETVLFNLYGLAGFACILLICFYSMTIFETTNKILENGDNPFLVLLCLEDKKIVDRNVAVQEQFNRVRVKRVRRTAEFNKCADVVA